MKALKKSFLTLSLFIAGTVGMQATAQTDTAGISSQMTGTFAISRAAQSFHLDAERNRSEGVSRAPMGYAPSSDISYNAVFGGSYDDYYYNWNNRDIKIASDGTVWMCAGTRSADGDLTAAGNHGSSDAWLLHIDPKTNQILYNRCFGGTGKDDFCSMLLMPDGTIWVCGTTNSSDGDLNGVAVKGSQDGWVLHIDPTAPATSQILYNRCIGGSGGDMFYRIAQGNDNTIWLCGETLSADGDNTSNGLHGSNSDAWLVAIDPTQNATAALKYNRCFGGKEPDVFFALQIISDGTVWCAGGTTSKDGDIATALVGNHGVASSTDGWLVHINPKDALTSQIKYNCCFGGTDEEVFSNITVLANNTIWLCGATASTDGDLTGVTTHGNDDVWLACVNTGTNVLTYNRCFGGTDTDGTNNFPSINFAFASDGTIWVLAYSCSEDADLTDAGNHGGYGDVWLFNVDPATNQFKYNKCFGGTGIDKLPTFALDEAKGYIWVSCCTTSNNDGDVPATHGGSWDAWIFSVKYGSGTGIDNVLADNSLKTWIENGVLHVSGLTAGKQWNVYNLSGMLIYQNVATDTQNIVSLQNHGIYIIKQGNNVVKTVY